MDDVQVRHTILNADVEEDLEMQRIQLNNITVEVDFLDSKITSLNADITSLEENDVSQNERLGAVEDDVDEWDDKITALEVANVDITDRLITVEEILLGALRYLY